MFFYLDFVTMYPVDLVLYLCATPKEGVSKLVLAEPDLALAGEATVIELLVVASFVLQGAC